MASRFVQTGRKILGVMRNHRAHAVELGYGIPTEPLIFLKPTSSYILEGQAIKLPKGVPDINHEVELGVVIGKGGLDIPESSAPDHIAGYFLALDMTDRVAMGIAMDKGLPWALAKGFHTACPVSSFIPKEAIADPQNVDLWLKVNGETKQDGNTKDMIFGVNNLISYMSERFLLEPGDTILTGTPANIGPVKAGDVITCGIRGITEMSFPVENW